MKAKLYIVGTGAAKGLITLKGIEAIEKSDIVLYDSLVSPDIIDLVKNEKIFVGKKGYDSHSVLQEEINEYLKIHLSEGKTVARLKGGDPAIFGRLTDELKVARDLNADIEVIPGITTASYFSAVIQKSLTSRYIASGVVFITGHSNKTPLESLHNWKALVDLNYTIVVYMGAKTIKKIINLLLDNGLKEDSLIASGESLGTENETIRLFKIKELLKEEITFKSPVIFIIGDILKYLEGAK
ncbi:MAG: uroporphyrinogen-III C-methyltransferase [Calditerrivibrio sp.]|nr:uroporphyrinogen-III C-methyltransferase [Calditerrivibrio sp.]